MSRVLCVETCDWPSCAHAKYDAPTDDRTQEFPGLASRFHHDCLMSAIRAGVAAGEALANREHPTPTASGEARRGCCGECHWFMRSKPDCVPWCRHENGMDSSLPSDYCSRFAPRDAEGEG